MRRGLLWCGVIGVVFFIATFLVLGAVRGEGYDPMRHPVSSLQLGGQGWTQTANFVITGLLLVAFGFGLGLAGEGKALPILVAVMGIGLTGAGVFETSPVNDYPVGTPSVMTTEGTLHDVFSIGFFLGLPIACFVMAYRCARARRRGRLVYSLVTGVAFLVLFVVTSTGFTDPPNPGITPISGLLQRVTIVVGLAWIAALAIGTLSTSRRRTVVPQH